jgi:hypothetical protein
MKNALAPEFILEGSEDNLGKMEITPTFDEFNLGYGVFEGKIDVSPGVAGLSKSHRNEALGSCSIFSRRVF